ncbi:MAG TPA: hypothetical protein VFN48_10935 [Solirubrobacteraceae bacterium]|nr:hypothetical protein [Solirubrobacteraceae bacterium]
MSVSRLIIALVWLVLAGVTLRWRGRLPVANLRRPGRARRLMLALGILYLLLGLLWLDLAFP